MDNSRTGMIALIPTSGNAARLMAADGEHPDDLHATILYLGDIDALNEDAFHRIVGAIESVVAEEHSPIVADGFNVSLFNPHNFEKDTCITLGLSGGMLEKFYRRLRERVLESIVDHSFEIPEQHEPWIPHVTLAYSDDHSLVKKLADRTGDVTFDRVRLALGDDLYDIPIGVETFDAEWDGENDADEDVTSEFVRKPFDESKHKRAKGRFAPKVVPADHTGGADVANSDAETSVADDLPPAEGYPFAGSSSFPTMTNADARALQQNMTDASPPPWTGAQKDAIYDYSTSAYQDVNNCLRTGAGCTDESHPDWGYVTNNVIRGVSESMRPTTQPLTTFRQANLASLGVSSPAELQGLVGQQGVDRGFASTTLDSTFAGLAGLDDFAGTPEVKMQIEVPEGAMAAYVAPESEWPEQQEFILAPNTRFEILEVQPAGAPGETSYVRVKVIPDGI